MITLVESHIIDPLKQDSPAVLVIYGNPSNNVVTFVGTLDDNGHVSQMSFTLPPRTKTAWIWRPNTDMFSFDVLELDQ